MGKKLPEVLSFEQVIDLIKHTNNKKHKTAFSLGFFCCLRVSEVCNLKNEDIDKGRKMLFIRQSKGKKDRFVPYPKIVSSGFSNIPLNISSRAIQKAINKQSKNILNRKINFHLLRHSGATHYLSKGMNIREVQQLLGHSKLDTTMIYTHISPDGIKNKMDEIWK